MTIVSISLTPATLAQLESLQQSLGIGRSEAARAAIQALAEQKEHHAIHPQTHYSASLTLVLAHTQRRALHELLHKQHELIRSQSHLCIDETRCMEILGLHGQGNQISEILQGTSQLAKIDRITLALEPCSNHKH